MKPVLFNTDMVRAILDGRKTVTRQVMKPQPVIDADRMWQWKDCQWMDGGLGFPASGIEDYAPCCPGDILYVRETFFKYAGEYVYRASAAQPELWNGMWRPSIHMPREAARIFLRVTDVSVERLQDITESQAIEEGCSGKFSGNGESIGCGWEIAPQDEFARIWDSTIKPADRALYGWEANPWVWVIAFERAERGME